MRKKKVLVQGTSDSLQKFFSDAVSRDFEIVAILSADPKGIAVEWNGKQLEVLAPEKLPKFIYELIYGVIFTTKDKTTVNFFRKQGMEPRKIILWNEKDGWDAFSEQDADGIKVMYFYGLEFHIYEGKDERLFGRTQRRLLVQRKIKNLKPERYPEVLSAAYQKLNGKPLDFNNPVGLRQKLEWIKIYDATPLKSRLADKYLVRNWVAEKIGEQYLIPLLGVWDDFDDIDFDTLPDQFVLKCNHSFGTNMIVRDKNSFDKRYAREKINAWLAIDLGAQPSLQLHYSRIEPKIIAEKFITDSGKNNDINDYKFWCFNGHVEHIQVDKNRSTNHVQRFYSTDWKPLPLILGRHKPDNEIEEKPSKLDEMLKIAGTLSLGFSIVRVDLYHVNDKIYFGEMTFTPLAGHVSWNLEGIDEYLGSLLTLPSPTPLATLSPKL